MLKLLVVLGSMALGVGVVAVGAQVTAPRPGVMTPALVWVQNRGEAEAVPVAIAAPETLDVRLAAPAAVTLSAGTTIRTQLARQAWDYQTVRVASGEDVAAALGAAGGDGWEAVGITAADQNGTTVLMKRPQPN